MLKVHRRKLVNIPVLLNVLGWLLCIEALFMYAPALMAYLNNEADALVFALAATVTMTVGAVVSYKTKTENRHIGRRDGFLLTALVWVVFSIFGMLPFIFGETRMGVSAAFFEAISGFTTTGVSTIPTSISVGTGMHLWRALMQWIGGMGIIVFTLAVIPFLNQSGGIQLFNAESTGVTHDKIRPRISETAKTLWGIYALLTLIAILMLWIGGMPLFDSLCHSLGAISTGGYGTASEYVSVDSYSKVVLIIFMFFGGVNFSLIYKAAHGHFKSLARNGAFKTYVGLTVVVSIAMAVIILCHGEMHSWRDITIEPVYQVVTTISSTGAPANGLTSWGPLAVVLCIGLMFCGGCAGSTSGGAKIDRLLYMFKHFRNEIYRCLYPNAVRPVQINGTVALPQNVDKAVAFLGLFVIMIFIGAVLLSIMNVPVGDSFFAVFSCICNTGYGTEIAGGSTPYNLLPDAALWVLSLEMLTGRLEIFTVLVLVFPAFWRK